MNENLFAEYLHYDPLTGKLYWKKSTGKGCTIGKEVGRKTKDGYRDFGFKGKVYKTHRAIWYMFNGKYPNGETDHINRIRDDNRIENLRDVTPRENSQNKGIPRFNELVGCHYHKKNMKWVAQFRANNKTFYIGSYLTEEEAHEAYLRIIKEWDLDLFKARTS